jgi:uncharacterized damage-inducible protein DinB
MDLESLRDEYDLARRYTQSLYEDLSAADVHWRPAVKSSSIAWHLGHQAVVNHILIRNLIAAEPSLNARFEALFDAANPEEQRGDLPALADIVAYRDAVAQHTHAHLSPLLSGQRPALQQGRHTLGAILISLIHHEYQHDCWIREMRHQLGHPKPDTVFSTRVYQLDGYWVLQLP